MAVTAPVTIFSDPRLTQISAHIATKTTTATAMKRFLIMGGILLPVGQFRIRLTRNVLLQEEDLGSSAVVPL
jgi:hypothetical protein